MYSGSRSVSSSFAYGAFTLSGRLSQNLSAGFVESGLRSEPGRARTAVWPPSISLAATLEIDVSFFSSAYLDVSVRRVPSITLWIHAMVLKVFLSGFPHSDISGSQDICSSPKLFAAYHVFHRLLVPRHPPCALISLTNSPSLSRVLKGWVPVHSVAPVGFCSGCPPPHGFGHLCLSLGCFFPYGFRHKASDVLNICHIL